MYVRQIDEQVLTLQVSGKLWMRSLVMRDEETKSEWAHLLGKGMAGKLKGRRLKPIVSDMVTWAAWKEQHPQTTVLQMSKTSKGYIGGLYNRRPERYVCGFEYDGQAYHVPLRQLIRKPLRQSEIGKLALLVTWNADGSVVCLFDRSINGKSLNFEQSENGTMVDTATKSTWNMLTGECVDGTMKGTALAQRVGIMSFANAWDNFHPDSKLPKR